MLFLVDLKRLEIIQIVEALSEFQDIQRALVRDIGRSDAVLQLLEELLLVDKARGLV